MASDESSAENTECREKKIVSSCMLLSSAFSQTPFVQPFLKPSLARNMVPVASPNIIRDLQNSVISTTDKVSKFLISLASHNPLLQKFFSLSSEFHSFCHQVRFKNKVKMSPLGNHNFAAVLPGDSVAGLVVANGIMSFLNIYNTLLIVRLVLTWFPNSPPAIVSPLRIRRSSSYGRPVAIILTIIAVFSPLYIDRRPESDLELEEQLINFTSLLPLLLLVLVLAITLSLCFDQSLSRFDPYWIHRVGGSSGGIIVILIILALVLKCKASINY